MHSPLDNICSIGAEIKVFNKFMKRIRFFNLAVEDEWISVPSMSSTNRLAGLGIANMHAMAKGSLVLEVGESQAVAREIIRMQGRIRTRRLEDKWEVGNHFA